MKKYIIALALLATTGSATLLAQTAKQTAHINYVLKNMKLDNATKTKFRPMLLSYYEDIAAVKKDNKELKEKYKADDEAGKLTDAQCDLLFNSKQKQETDELAIRKKYYAQFKTVLTVQQAYKAIRLCNDKVE